MPGPAGNFDDVIMAILAQQQGGEQPQLAGAADVYQYGNGMAPQAGMPTPEQMQASKADQQQAILLKQALKAMQSQRPR